MLFLFVYLGLYFIEVQILMPFINNGNRLLLTQPIAYIYKGGNKIVPDLQPNHFTYEYVKGRCSQLKKKGQSNILKSSPGFGVRQNSKHNRHNGNVCISGQSIYPRLHRPTYQATQLTCRFNRQTVITIFYGANCNLSGVHAWSMANATFITRQPGLYLSARWGSTSFSS